MSYVHVVLLHLSLQNGGAVNRKRRHHGRRGRLLPDILNMCSVSNAEKLNVRLSLLYCLIFSLIWICRAVALTLVVAGFLFSVLAAGSCRFLRFQETPTHENGGAFGLFFFTNPAGSCQRYSDFAFNFTDKTARVGAIIAPIFALVAIVLQLIDLLCWRVCCGKCSETTLLLLAIIFQGLTFAAFGSSTFWCVRLHLCAHPSCGTHLSLMMTLLPH